MIEFKCSRCGKQLRVKNEAAGTRGKCPQCAALLQVPEVGPQPALGPQVGQSVREVDDGATASSADAATRRAGPSRTEEAASHVAGSENAKQFDQQAKIAVWVGGLGLLVLALSPLFKWVSFGGGGVTGISGDGKIVLGVTAVAIVAYATAVFTSKMLIAVALGVGAWGTVALFWMGGLIWKVGSVLDSPDVEDNPFAAIIATQVSPGPGLYLGLIGGLVVAGALGFLAFRQMQPVGRLTFFCICQSGALVLGVLVAIAVGPKRPADETRGTVSPDAPPSPFSFLETDESGAGEWDREQAVNEVEQLRARLAAEEREHAVEEIEQLREKLAAEKQDMLARFVVQRCRFRRTDTGFIGGNVIELSVHNGTDRAVSRAYFHAVLLTPGREMPWVDEDFNYQIAGGLEPGESATWSLGPNMFGAWRNAPSDRGDLILIVRPVGLDGADGSSLTGDRFTERDAERLRALLDSTEYGEAPQVRDALNARDQALRQWRVSAVRAAVRSEIEYLRGLKVESETAQASLAKFVVERSRFYFSEDGFSSDPVIDLTVTNNTGQTVSRFYCRGVLSSPGRDTPWVDDTFNYSVRGGIQPSETQQFSLAPNMFGPWGRAPKDRQDMLFSVEVYRLDGPDEAELYPSEWSEEDAKRLAVLEKMAREHGW